MPLESLLGPTVTTWIAHAVAALTAFALLYGFAKIMWTRLTGRPFPVNRVTRGLDALAELGTNVLGFVNKLTRGNGQPLLTNPDVQRRDALIAEMSAALDDMRRRLGDAPLPVAVVAEKAGAVAVSDTRGAFDPAQRQAIAPDVVAVAQRITRESERGSVDLAGLIGCVVIAALATVIACGCGPRVLREPVVATPPDGCVDGATTCHNGAPWRCRGNRWSQADRVCSLLGTDASPAPVCCLTQSALREDAVLHACVPTAACLPEAEVSR